MSSRCWFPARAPFNQAPTGYCGRHGQRTAAACRGALVDVPRLVARVGPAVPEPLDPRQDGGPGGPRQRRAAGDVRRPLATDVLADRRRARAARMKSRGLCELTLETP